MGLLRALAELPFAPVKGLVWLARHVEQQAERERAKEFADLQAQLLELQLIRDEQDLGDEEDFAVKEAQLLEKIGAMAGAEKAGEEG